ncbi:MAG: class I tRNA ligase family protein, partial [Ignavibacteriae bacterium]|nr:class I tRNA ligase family protein [Ignavibacteriota bacterium]
CRKDLITYSLERFTFLLAPLAPHLGEECWKLLGNDDSIFQNPPKYEIDKKSLAVDNVTIVVQVNGKIRAKLNLPTDSEELVVKEAAFADENVILHSKDKTVVKEIYIKNKIYNIVVK